MEHKLRAHEHPRLALSGVAPRLVLGHLRVLVSGWIHKKDAAAHLGGVRFLARDMPGRRIGTGLGRGDPSTGGASGLQGPTFKKCQSRV